LSKVKNYCRECWKNRAESEDEDESESESESESEKDTEKDTENLNDQDTENLNDQDTENLNEKENKRIWCVHCEICGHLLLETGEIQKECTHCKKTVGWCCGRLFHCQSTESLCKNCFDLKCYDCDCDLPLIGIYFSDLDKDSDGLLAPICKECQKQQPDESMDGDSVNHGSMDSE